MIKKTLQCYLSVFRFVLFKYFFCNCDTNLLTVRLFAALRAWIIITLYCTTSASSESIMNCNILHGAILCHFITPVCNSDAAIL